MHSRFTWPNPASKLHCHTVTTAPYYTLYNLSITPYCVRDTGQSSNIPFWLCCLLFPQRLDLTTLLGCDEKTCRANKVLPQKIDWMLETVNPSAAGVSLRCFVEVTHVPGEVSTRLPVEVMKSFTQACISVCLCLFVYVRIVYGSARRSVLKQLDPIHHQGLWIALGAFRTSPAQSIYT